jgi:hypothetical protein
MILEDNSLSRSFLISSIGLLDSKPETSRIVCVVVSITSNGTVAISDNETFKAVDSEW